MASHPHPGLDARTHWLAESTDTAPGVIAGLSPAKREELARRVANEQADINPDADPDTDADDEPDAADDAEGGATQSQATGTQSQGGSRGIAAGSRDARDEDGAGSLGEEVRALTRGVGALRAADRDDADGGSGDDDAPVFAPNADPETDASSTGDGSGYTDSLGVLRGMDDADGGDQ